MKTIVSLGLALLNANAFLLMAIDKSRAKRGKWRIPEKTLFLAAACFGGLGGLLGMYLFRHKTKHWRFRLFFPMLLAAQIALLTIGFYWL